MWQQNGKVCWLAENDTRQPLRRGGNGAPILLFTNLQEGGVSILYVLTCVSDILPRFGVARREFEVPKEQERGSWLPVSYDLDELRLCEGILENYERGSNGFRR
jgi:hypothetical protein